MNRLGSNLNTFTLMSAGHTVKSQRAAAQMWTVHAIATWKCVNKFVYANTRRFLNKYENVVKNGSESHRRGLEYKPSINLTLFILWESRFRFWWPTGACVTVITEIRQRIAVAGSLPLPHATSALDFVWQVASEQFFIKINRSQLT